MKCNNEWNMVRTLTVNDRANKYSEVYRIERNREWNGSYSIGVDRLTSLVIKSDQGSYSSLLALVAAQNKCTIVC